VDRVYAKTLSGDERVFSAISSPHEPEHCLEVQYPFIQTVYPDVPTLPMLFGEIDPVVVGEILNEVLREDDLIIVSSDLSHYHDNTSAHKLDQRLLDAVLHGDEAGVRQGEACGQAPILALMTIAKARGWQPHLLNYRTSGDITGDRRQVVGYAAVAYVGA
jgi:AmmeMemoRadiSam system protein B